MTTKKPRKKKAPYPFPVELIDQLLAQVENKDAESILGETGLAGQLKKMLAERMLSAELSHYLDNEGEAVKNHRNGSSPKKMLTPSGELQLDIPRDRLSSFEPKLVAKHQRRMLGFDDHVISMYARGMSVREIQGHLLELYGTQVSPDLISTITDEVLEEVAQWQQPPLEAMYSIVYFDALRLKIFIQPTPLKAYTCACARSSKIAVTSPVMRRPANCSSWPCAILRKIGRCHSEPGNKLPTSSLSCSASASPTRLINHPSMTSYTKFLTGPQNLYKTTSLLLLGLLPKFVGILAVSLDRHAGISSPFTGIVFSIGFILRRKKQYPQYKCHS